VSKPNSSEKDPRQAVQGESERKTEDGGIIDDNQGKKTGIKRERNVPLPKRKTFIKKPKRGKEGEGRCLPKLEGDQGKTHDNS